MVGFTLRRRQFMTGGAAITALLLAGAGRGNASNRRTRLTAAARWETGNTSLVPATLQQHHVYFGGNHMVGALDIATGAVAWRQTLVHPCQFRLRVSDGIVVAGGGSFLAAWQASDGTPLWQAAPNTRFGVPLIHEGRLYCGDGHQFMARDLRRGTVLWTFEAVPDTVIAYGPAASGNTIFVGPGDGRLYALSAENGKLLWSVNRVDDWQYLRQLYVAGDVLVAGTYQEKLLGLSVADGQEIWSVNAGNFINSQHVADGTAYFWSPTGWVFAVDTQSGQIRWRHQTTDYGGSHSNWATLVAELVTAGNRLFALDLANVLHVLDRKSGEEIGRFDTPGAVRPFILPLSAKEIIFGLASGDLCRCSLPA